MTSASNLQPKFKVLPTVLVNYATFVVKDADELLPLSTTKDRDKPFVKGFLKYDRPTDSFACREFTR
jgi:hypothetical protein